jgi:hypothetical protein
MITKLLRILLFTFLIPLFVVIAVLALPLIAAYQVYEFVALRWYCWRRHCWTYLVCSPRRAWHEFIENNLLPALPESVGVAWTSGPLVASKPLRRIFGAGAGKGKPYLAHVAALRTRVYPLHQLLQPLKSRSHRDESVQQELRTLLDQQLDALLG